MKSGTILELNPISKTLPGVVALDDDHFDLRKKERVLSGENGAGKSMLVIILSNAYQKTSGTILINPQAIQIKNPGLAQRLIIRFIYIISQELNLVPYLSVIENTLLGQKPVKKNLVHGIGMVDQKIVRGQKYAKKIECRSNRPGSPGEGLCC